MASSGPRKSGTIITASISLCDVQVFQVNVDVGAKGSQRKKAKDVYMPLGLV